MNICGESNLPYREKRRRTTESLRLYILIKREDKIKYIKLLTYTSNPTYVGCILEIIHESKYHFEVAIRNKPPFWKGYLTYTEISSLRKKGCTYTEVLTDEEKVLVLKSKLLGKAISYAD